MDGQIVGSADPALSRIHRVRLRLPQGRLVACNKVSSVSRCQSGPRSPGCHASHFYTFPPARRKNLHGSPPAPWSATKGGVEASGCRGCGTGASTRKGAAPRDLRALLASNSKRARATCLEYRLVIFPPGHPPFPCSFLPPLIPPAPPPARLTPERYFICKELVCRLPLLLILCAQEFLLGSAEISYCSRRNRGRERG